MKLFARNPSRDPIRIREVLQQLSDELSEGLGADLESLVLYGEFARIGRLETEYDSVNLMLVVRSVTCRTLDKMAGAIARGEQEVPLTTMTLTREDLHSSCDVFPIKFYHMQQHHRVLSGEDVLSDLVISDDHLRLRCEQQLKNLMLRLRATYLHRNQSAQQLLDALLDAARNLLRDMQACLVVKSGLVPEDDAEIVRQFGVAYDLDTEIVNEVMELRRNAASYRTEDLKQIFDRFMRLVHSSALAIDETEVGL